MVTLPVRSLKPSVPLPLSVEARSAQHRGIHTARQMVLKSLRNRTTAAENTTRSAWRQHVSGLRPHSPSLPVSDGSEARPHAKRPSHLAIPAVYGYHPIFSVPSDQSSLQTAANWTSRASSHSSSSQYERPILRTPLEKSKNTSATRCTIGPYNSRAQRCVGAVQPSIKSDNEIAPFPAATLLLTF